MYGDWQMEKLSAEDYAKHALEFAKAMKWADPAIKLVVCGLQDSCDWNVEALKRLYKMADYISAHVYAVGGNAVLHVGAGQTMIVLLLGVFADMLLN